MHWYEHDPRHHQELPLNPKLWRMVVAQARARFTTYPSPAASHWVHAEYVKLGGRFTDSTKKIPQRLRREEKADQERDKKTDHRKADRG